MGSGGTGGPVVNGSWFNKTPLNTARNLINTVATPTGEILVTQGSPDAATGTGNAIEYPELYDPGRQRTDLGTSTIMSPSNLVPDPQAGPKPASRTYHHLAVLLPDGRVFIAGGEHPDPNNMNGSAFANGQFSGEIFTPPYLETGLTRPVIQDIDAQVKMRPATGGTTTFQITVAHVEEPLVVDRVVLTRPASVTHGFDSDQRYIELEYTAVVDPNQTVLTVASPADNLGPPGIYMVWVMFTDGTVRLPTEAAFVSFQ